MIVMSHTMYLIEVLMLKACHGEAMLSMLLELYDYPYPGRVTTV